jgi:16S rRNA (adenine(1408)-N(1))-methyltransferase
VIDIGTGDGRFVSASAKTNPDKFFIGIDANVKPLEKPSIKATRKPSKGGQPNALFMQAAVEDLPDELTGIANEIHINFPWGSLLRAVMIGDENVLTSLRRIAADGSSLRIITGLDLERDRSEIERLGLPQIDAVYVQNELVTRYASAGFELINSAALDANAWKQIETSWAKKLSGNRNRNGLWMEFTAV